MENECMQKTLQKWVGKASKCNEEGIFFGENSEKPSQNFSFVSVLIRSAF